MRSMPSTSRVTWSLRTSATDRGRVMVGSGRHDPSGSTNRFAVKIGDASAYPVIGTTGAISLLHLVGLRRSLVRLFIGDGTHSRAIFAPMLRQITPMPPRAIAIGDIHGCSRALAALVDAIAPAPEDLLVVLGDYIDRGPDSRGVIDRLIDLGRRC